MKGENLDVLKIIAEYVKDSKVYENINKIIRTKKFPIKIKSSADNIIIKPTRYRCSRDRISNSIYMSNIINSLFYTIEFSKYQGEITFHSLNGDFHFSIIGRPFRHTNGCIKLYARDLLLEIYLFITY